MPPVAYADSDGVKIAYQVSGSGDRDVLVVPGFVSHRELAWQNPAWARGWEALGERGRVIQYDKRGTGMSDRVEEVPTLEDRVRDAIAVLDAVGSERATLMGVSEGAAASILFAAMHPNRVSALLLAAGAARACWAEDYPIGNTAEAMIEASAELLAPFWGTGATVEYFSPSMADVPGAREFTARMEQMGSTLDMMSKLFLAYLEVDVRDVLPSLDVPTLIVHRRDDRVVDVRHGRYLAEHIPGAEYVELPGIDHNVLLGTDEFTTICLRFMDAEAKVEDASRAVTTVMFTDIVGSTEQAASMGDAAWRSKLALHDDVVRLQLQRFDGVEVKTMGDGFLVRFDGPVRAARCGLAIVEAARAIGLEVRVGIHTGEVDLIGDDIGGITVHMAARVGELAGPSEVLVSSSVVGLAAGSGLRFDDRGEHEFKGFTDARGVFAVKDLAQAPANA